MGQMQYIHSSGGQKPRSGTMHKDADDHLLINVSFPSWREQEPMQDSVRSHFKRVPVLSKVPPTTSKSSHTVTGEGLQQVSFEVHHGGRKS